MGREILYRIGDDPLSELAELDSFYMWSARIRRILSILYPRKKRSILPYVVLGILGLGLILTAAAIFYLAFYVL
ncbi:MAG: hypothetical protein ACMUIG_10175 [Thermoplasmatota archaeon]